MVLKKGTLLENVIENIFSSIGFNTKTNIRIAGYEVDILAEKEGVKIIVECKQYEKGTLTIRNLIHEWYGKNLEIKADRVILALYGLKINPNDEYLASEKNIILWDGDKINYYLKLISKDKKRALKKLLDELNLDIKRKKEYYSEYSKKYKEFLLITLMSGDGLKDYDKEDLYLNFILDLKDILKENILPKLKNKEKFRKIYAEIFLDIEKEYTENSEKWNKIKEIIKKNNNLFPKGKIKNIHLEAIKKLEESFEKAKEYFNEKDKKKLRFKLIKTALEMIEDEYGEDEYGYDFIEKELIEDPLDNSISHFSPQICLASKQNPEHKLKVAFFISNQSKIFYFQIDKNILTEDDIEKLEWLIDKPIKESYKYEKGKKIITVDWYSDEGINKAIEYIEKVFKEIFKEKEDFCIVLEELYLDKIKDKIKKIEKIRESFWVFLIIGIFLLPLYGVGIIFLILAWKKHKEIKKLQS